MAAQLDFITGTMLPATEEKRSKGFVGFSIENFEKNLWPEFTFDSVSGKLHNFFTVFAVFFPGDDLF